MMTERETIDLWLVKGDDGRTVEVTTRQYSAEAWASGFNAVRDDPRFPESERMRATVEKRKAVLLPAE